MNLSTKKNRNVNRNATIGHFEVMEDRKLFAADVMGAADMAADLSDRAESDMQAVVSPVENAGGERVELQVATVIPGEGVLKPAPDDDGPAGPIGPVYKVADRVSNELSADQLSPAGGNGYGKPAPDDDDGPIGPIGPVYKVATEMFVDPTALQELDLGNAKIPTVAIDPTGGSQAKPDDQIDCDGNPLSASCDFAAEVPVEEAKPDDQIDCDGNPLTASCDLTAEPEFDHFAHPGDANGDGTTDFNDFLILTNNFGNGDATRAEGDFNGNGTVDFNDFLIQSKYFGTSAAKVVDIVFAI